MIAELFQVVWHTLVIYFFLILALTFVGRRQISRLSITELVVIMVLGSAVETAMVAGNTSLPAGLASAATLLLANWGFAGVLARSRRLRRLMMGRPLLLVYKGRLLAARLAAAGLTEEDLMEGLRKRGFGDLAQVKIAVLEIDGGISVVRKK